MTAPPRTASATFTAVLFADNEAVLKLFGRLGEVTISRRDGSVLEISVKL